MPRKEVSDLRWGDAKPKPGPLHDPWIDPISTPEHWLTWLKGRLEIDPPQLLISDVIGGSGGFGEGMKLTWVATFDGGPIVPTWSIQDTPDDIDPYSFVVGSGEAASQIVIPFNGYYMVVLLLQFGAE